MTKDGRPSPIRDIRYFGQERAYLDEHEATAFGRRLALCLRASGFSLAHWTHLYVVAIPTADQVPIIVEPPSLGDLDWWLRDVRVPVPLDFGAQSASERAATLAAATEAALCSIRPDAAAEVCEACAVVRREGAALRFLVKQKRSRSSQIEVCVGVSAHPAPSVLEVYCASGGDTLRSPSLPLRFFTDAWMLVDRVEETCEAVIVHAKKSITARLTSKSYGSPLRFARAHFALAVPPPLVTPIIGGPI